MTSITYSQDSQVLSAIFLDLCHGVYFKAIFDNFPFHSLRDVIEKNDMLQSLEMSALKC